MNPVRISLNEQDFKDLIKGKIVDKGRVHIALQDIGYPLILRELLKAILASDASTIGKGYGEGMEDVIIIGNSYIGGKKVTFSFTPQKGSGDYAETLTMLIQSILALVRGLEAQGRTDGAGLMRLIVDTLGEGYASATVEAEAVIFNP